MATNATIYLDAGSRIRIRSGWDGAGCMGTLLHGPIYDLKKQSWMCIQWDDDEDPELHKTAGLEIAHSSWKAMIP